jgi:lipid A disaccharide synthetase
MIDHWQSSINLVGFKLILPPLINYRRKEEHQHIAKRVEDIFDQEISVESIQKIFEEEREEYNHDEPSDSKDKWEKI